MWAGYNYDRIYWWYWWLRHHYDQTYMFNGGLIHLHQCIKLILVIKLYMVLEVIYYIQELRIVLILELLVHGINYNCQNVLMLLEYKLMHKIVMYILWLIKEMNYLLSIIDMFYIKVNTKNIFRKMIGNK